ncbi:hypothetical protein W02_10310 [Nitrospira sp. KM1]|nr:hypothetical protein W02_10310 [Nitrospira sp. KM1]
MYSITVQIFLHAIQGIFGCLLDYFRVDKKSVIVSYVRLQRTLYFAEQHSSLSRDRMCRTSSSEELKQKIRKSRGQAVSTECYYLSYRQDENLGNEVA